MTEPRQGTALQTIFSFFLAIMVTAFIGVAVHTFYPSPGDDIQQEMRSLARQQQAIVTSQAPEALTTSDRTRIQSINDRRDKLQDASRALNDSWSGRTSMILVGLATLVLAISLVLAGQLPVISNGLLLGGVFTMLYGVGSILGNGSSGTRFAVISLTLLITLALGYLRFVRGPAPLGSAPGVTVARDGGDVTRLEQRVRSLEERLDGAANLLAGRSGERSAE